MLVRHFPSIPSSPEVEQLVDKVNEEYTAPMAADTPPDSPPPQLSIGETLALLDQPQEEVVSPLSPRPFTILNSPPCIVINDPSSVLI